MCCRRKMEFLDGGNGGVDWDLERRLNEVIWEDGKVGI